MKTEENLLMTDSITGFAHAAGFAAARRCLRFLVAFCFCVVCLSVVLGLVFYCYAKRLGGKKDSEMTYFVLSET